MDVDMYNASCGIMDLIVWNVYDNILYFVILFWLNLLSATEM